MAKPLTKEFLIKRGYCCGSKCANCPYHPKHEKGSTTIVKLLDELLDDVESGALQLGSSAHKCYMNKEHELANTVTWVHDDELKKYLVLRHLSTKVDRAIQQG